jgi:uncharacterized membrane protein (UPF0136 family)
MKKITAVLLGRTGPTLFGIAWLFVCLVGSEMGFTRSKCSASLLIEGTAVGIVLWYATGYVFARVFISRDNLRLKKE